MMRQLKLSILVIACLIFPGQLFAQELSVADGNIHLSQPNGAKTQLTKSGHDRGPIMSPDGRTIVFIRKSSEKADYAAESPKGYSEDELLADQIWAIDSRTQKERLIVREKISEDLESAITHIQDGSFRFSPDGETLYFMSDAWVTSGAIHSVKLDGSHLQFVTAGNSFDIVPGEEYKGDLIVSQHRYFVGAGSYDWLWLFDPAGKEIGPIGEELTMDQRNSFGMSGLNNTKPNKP